MVTLNVFVLDASYRIVDGKAKMYLYGRTTEGKQVVIVDSTFDPYFIIIPKQIDACKARLAALEAELSNDEMRIIRVDEHKKFFDGKETTILKVFTNIPGAVPRISEMIKDWPELRMVNENDVLFVRRYLIDKGIYPFSQVEVSGEWCLEASRAAMLQVSTIKPLIDVTYNHPKMLAVDIETYQDMGRGVDMVRNPILMIALYGPDFQKVITWKHFDGAAPFVDFVDSEEAMIRHFREHMIAYGPDIVVGYYSDGFDLPYIKARADKYRIKLDLGMDHSEVRVLTKIKKQVEIPGLVHLDILGFIRRVIGRTMDTDVFSLDAVSEELLGERKMVVDLDSLSKHWDDASRELARYAEYNLHDAKLTYQLAEKVLPNLVELVRLSGLLPFDASRGSITHLIEGYIFRQAREWNIVVYNRPGYSESSARMHRSAKGGFVFEPTPGLYENIVVFDFRSLYPSIIVSHNISPETLRCSCCEGKNLAPVDGQRIWYCEKKQGFVPTILDELVERRNRIKELLKKNKKDALLIARSDALKWMANSFYGYLGFSQSRWYSFEGVESITGYGRNYIMGVIEQARKRGFEVLYSDTDSIFLQLTKNTKEDALRFLEEVNFTLPGKVELDFENYYPAGLFVGTKASAKSGAATEDASDDADEPKKGAKKRYALVDERGELKIRGFETVRRNTSLIAKETQKHALELILKDRNNKAALEYVKGVINALREAKIPAGKVTILTMLTKDTSGYETKGPHVAAAERMKAKGYAVGAGTMIKYVIAKGSPKDKIRDKVRLPEELKDNEYDASYYIENQIIPSVERIFQVIGYSKEDLLGKANQKTLGGFF
ncbi:ribonuclease H-like domain-containing protein [Candidatus Woesearchaeota archaeon]|nr:ribonuclease H-like domain-containing protein [Candidatus Woesearchaeota archaeon]